MSHRRYLHRHSVYIALSLAGLTTSAWVGAAQQAPEKAQVEVVKGETDVKVKQPAPSVDIDQKDAKVDVKVGEPEVDIQYEKPDVNIQQPEPKVDVEQAQPEVIVNTAEPEVTVNKAEPNIEIQKSEPEIKIVRKDASGKLRDNSDIATITQLSIGDLEEKVIKNSAGEEVGEISQVVMNKNTQQLALVIEAGGFFGLGSSTVAMPLDEVRLEGNDLIWNENTDVEQLPEYTQSGFAVISEKQKQIKDIVQSK